MGNNMFVYCLNNPVNYTDHLGEDPTVAVVSLFVAGGIVICVVKLADYAARTIVSLIDLLADTWDSTILDVIFADETASKAQVQTAEHTKNRTEKNRNKHENGNARRQRDQGGEKKKQKKGWDSNPNKRGKNHNEKKFYSVY